MRACLWHCNPCYPPPAIHAIEIAYASLFHPTRVQGAPVPAPNGHPREGTTSTLIPSREQNSDDPDQSTTGDDTFATYLPAVQNAETATTGLVRAAQVTTATLYLSTDLGSDILEVDVATGTATLYFDASDVGILSQDVNALHLETDGSLLFSLAKPKSLPGITGFVDDSDVVRFVPTSLGETTAGTFALYLDGSDVGLSTNGEDIDALGRAPDGRLVISLLGSYAVTGLSGDEEDLLVFNETSLGDTTAGTWERYFDGSDVGLSDDSDEDLQGSWIDPTSGEIYLTTDGSFTTHDGVSGDGNDIIVCQPTTLGATTDCTFQRFWDGDVQGFANDEIDAFFIANPQGGGGLPARPVIAPIVDGDGDGSYTITWSTIADAVTYQLEESPNAAAGQWRTVSNGAAISATVAAPSVDTWCYRVRANYSDRAGLWSDQSCLATTIAGPTPPLAAQPGPAILYYSRLNANIYAVDLTTGVETIHFDAIDMGLISPNISAFHLEADESILFALDRTTALPGIIGVVDEFDIVRFVPVAFGDPTIGTFELYLDGSDVGLTDVRDDVEAISRAPDGRLVISTDGYLDPALAAWPLDRILVFNATSLGYESSGTWETYFDSGDVGLNDSNDENIQGLWIDGPAGDLYLVNRFNYTTHDGLSGDADDILRCAATSIGENSSCSFSLFWDGDQHGASGRIDDISIRQPRPAPGTLTGQVFLDADYDGQRTGSDSPWGQRSITLWSKVGAVDTTMTDAAGLYHFPAYPGRYEIGVAQEPGYSFSPQDVGDDATDSDVDATGRSATVVLTSTQVITIDAGMGILPTPMPTPTQPPSPLPTPPPFSPLPTPTPTPQGYTLPTRSLIDQCFFTPPPGGIPTEPIIPLSAYSFSPPQEIITHTAPIGIEQWLPDNETLLITRETLTNQLRSAELVNTSTGTVTQIVEPRNYLRQPMWLAQNDTVLWRQTGDPQANESGYWIRSLSPLLERQLSAGGSGSSMTHDIAPDGKQLVFMSLPGGTQPLIWNQETLTLTDLPIDLTHWRYQKGPRYRFQGFYPLWHPDGDKILFHDGTWMMFYDLTTNIGCDIDLRTATDRNYYIRGAQWSPDGRYLLINNGASPLYTTLEGPYDQLLVLDIYTGNVVQYSLGNTIYDFSWGADSQTVAISGKTGEKVGQFDAVGTSLFNVISGEQQQILPQHTFVNGKWSPDGSRLAANCVVTLPDGYEIGTYRICTSQVNLTQ